MTFAEFIRRATMDDGTVRLDVTQAEDPEAYIVKCDLADHGPERFLVKDNTVTRLGIPR